MTIFSDDHVIIALYFAGGGDYKKSRKKLLSETSQNQMRFIWCNPDSFVDSIANPLCVKRLSMVLGRISGQKFIHFLVELLCIVIAVTLSFYLDDLREDQKDREVLKGIVSSLILDIEALASENESRVQFSTDAMDTIDLVIQLASEGKPISTEIMHTFLYFIGNDHSFDSGSSSAYMGLLSSQVWQEVPDSISQSVFYLYEGNYGFSKVVVTRVADYCAFIKTHYFPKFHIDFYNVKGDNYAFESRSGEKSTQDMLKALVDPEFRSALIMLRNEYHKSVRYMNEAAIASKENVTRLKAYLEEL